MTPCYVLLVRNITILQPAAIGHFLIFQVITLLAHAQVFGFFDTKPHKASAWYSNSKKSE